MPGVGDDQHPQPADPAGTPREPGPVPPVAGSAFSSAPGSPASGEPWRSGPTQTNTFPWAQPHMPSSPGYPGYGGHPFGAPAGATDTLLQPAPVRRTGRWRIGVAGLVAGAVIGGGAGAGVASLLDQPTSTGGSPAAAQNVVIKNPDSATTATAAAAKAAPSVVTIYVTSGSAAGSGSGGGLTHYRYRLAHNPPGALGGARTRPGPGRA